MYRMSRTFLRGPGSVQAHGQTSWLTVWADRLVGSKPKTSSAKFGPFIARSGRINYATQAAAEPFLNGSSSVYLEEMYAAWQKDPNSVHKVS